MMVELYVSFINWMIFLFIFEVFFMESICEDSDIVAANIKVCFFLCKLRYFYTD